MMDTSNSKWVVFEEGDNLGSCGYCGMNSEQGDTKHFCDGFGHMQEVTGEVQGRYCTNCQQGRFCEHAFHLEYPGAPLPEPTYEDGSPVVR